ncbi:MAG: sigma-54-dependent Fis family transcriptional regulator [Acidobacteria bacterium]|nr:sigma-54-dependent Fis family transcriptional regulator [Acidobacteriota bacterium]
MKPRILVIDDEAAIRDSLRMILEYEGYGFVGAASGHEGLALAERERPDLVLLDIKMPGMDGMEVLRTLRALDDSLPVVMISGHGTTSTAVEAIKSGAVDFLDKPLGSERVIVTLQNVLKQQELRRENRELKLAMESKYEIVGQSPALRSVLEAVKRAAPTGATVLLLGESGVGKELVARTIHRNSARAGQRFVQVNCAAIPEELIESELFGHEKGSFTGATEKQLGKFEQADRGTIFLDEVADMSARTQAKVLRVLQEQEVERIGSARTIKVDVRVIAATNRNLEEMIQRGEFREDLYFRLNVIPIAVPPLRERREDIPLLVQHFARRTSEEHNLRLKRFDPRAMEALQRHRWRGNIREVRNAVERVMIMAPGEVVRVEDLPQEVRGDLTARAAAPEQGAPAAAAASASPPVLPAAGTLREFKDAAERAFLVQKLRENNWNISKTAEVIDTPRSNLYKKLEQYGISQEVDG